MMRSTRTIAVAPMLVAVALATPIVAVRGQDTTRTIDFGNAAGSPVDADIPDTILRAAIARFNAPTTARVHGTFVLPAGKTIDGPLGVHLGTARISGTVRGDIIVLNGDLRIDDGGAVTGRVTVLGGRIVLASGANVGGAREEYASPAPVRKEPDGTVTFRARRRGIADYTAASATFVTGGVSTTLRAEGGVYNRVEGLPIKVGPIVQWNPDRATALNLRLTGIIRTAGDAEGFRDDFGWEGRIELVRSDPSRITVALDAGSTIAPMFDRSYSSLESGLGTFLLRRDYRDWYKARAAAISASYGVNEALTIRGTYRWARERTVRSVDVFSVLRAEEPWRPNPVIDDGQFGTVGAGITWDTRDDARRPTSGWLVNVDARHTMSDELSPVTLPGLIRDNMPTAGYAATEVDFDIRRYLRLDPRQSVHLRLAGGGWVAGDPLTVQHRRSMGGADPLAGFGFREVNCDRRRRPDPAGTALCDRQMVVQAEFRRTINLGINTRVAGFSLGLEQADLILLGDAGSAWVAGEGAGRVPSSRIQALDEWLADLGAGIEGRFFGIFIGKSVVDDTAPRLSFRLRRRF